MRVSFLSPTDSWVTHPSLCVLFRTFKTRCHSSVDQHIMIHFRRIKMGFFLTENKYISLMDHSCHHKHKQQLGRRCILDKLGSVLVENMES